MLLTRLVPIPVRAVGLWRYINDISHGTLADSGAGQFSSNAQRESVLPE